MTTSELLIIGLGNPLMRDDGLGPALIARLQQAALPGWVTLLDAGAPGLALLELWQGYERVWLVDAVDMGHAPGSWRWFAAADLEQLPDTGLDAHGGVGAALKLAAAMERLPAEFRLLGIQPQTVARGIGLSPAAEQGVQAGAAEVRCCLA